VPLDFLSVGGLCQRYGTEFRFSYRKCQGHFVVNRGINWQYNRTGVYASPPLDLLGLQIF
jgi:hypothetical protein